MDGGFVGVADFAPFEVAAAKVGVACCWGGAEDFVKLGRVRLYNRGKKGRRIGVEEGRRTSSSSRISGFGNMSVRKLGVRISEHTIDHGVFMSCCESGL